MKDDPQSIFEVDIRNDWACPGCGARALVLHHVTQNMESLWEDGRPPSREPVKLTTAQVECSRGHRHPLPEGAVWSMTPEESAAIETAQREAEEARSRAAAEFKARIEGRTIVAYAPSDDGGSLALTLDDGSVLRIEAGGDWEAWLSIDLDAS